MFTKMATIFTLMRTSGWKFDTTFLNGMQTLCMKLKSIAIVGSETKSVKERYGRAGSGRFISKIHFRDKTKTFFINNIFSKTHISKLVRHFQTMYLKELLSASVGSFAAYACFARNYPLLFRSRQRR